MSVRAVWAWLLVGAFVLVGGLLGGWVLVDEVTDRDRLVAVRAQAAVVDAGAGAVAVVAPLPPEVADVTFGAAVDGDVASRGASGRWGDRWGLGRRVAGSPGALPAGRGAVPLASDRGERGAAGRAGCCRLDVVTDVVTLRGHCSVTFRRRDGSCRWSRWSR